MLNHDAEEFCPICFQNFNNTGIIHLSLCSCSICSECLQTYVATRINDQASTTVPCPVYGCKAQGYLTVDEIRTFSSASSFQMYSKLCRDRDVFVNPYLTFCPAPGCDTVCDIPRKSISSSLSAHVQPRSYLTVLRHTLRIHRRRVRNKLSCLGSPVGENLQVANNVSKVPSLATNFQFMYRPVPVTCSTCHFIFCPRCHRPWHPSDPSSPCLHLHPPDLSSHTSKHPGHLNYKPTKFRNQFKPTLSFRWTSKTDQADQLKKPIELSALIPVGYPPYPPDAWLKRCPTCLVPIERLEGCAQIRCRFCKHTFCWFCLTSLDTDFLLRHYDKGACKGKLGHTTGTLLGHRLYVIAALTGLTIFFILTAPFVLLSLPCYMCVRCRDSYRCYRLRKRHASNLEHMIGVLPSEDVIPTAVCIDAPSSSLPHYNSNHNTSQLQHETVYIHCHPELDRLMNTV